MGSKVGKILFLVLFFWVFTHGNLYSQKYWELGFAAGTSYYQGDINHARHFYKPNPAFGGFLRYAHTQRWQSKIQLIGGYLAGDDLDFDNRYQQIRAHSFATPLIDLTGQIEFNFKPYRLVDKKKFFSPYIFTGATFFIASYATDPYQMAIPFGVGMKVNFLKYFALNLEWGFRKTFTDNIDRLSWYKTLPVRELTPENSLMKQKGYYNQKDWYSICIATLSFKIYSNDRQCHVYSN